MKFLVAETIHYSLDAEDGASAISCRKQGAGIAFTELTAWRASKWHEDQKPIPRKDWPIWAKALAVIAKPEDKGIGDVVARTIGAENSEAFKKRYKATTGKECGCNGRQNLWNQKYPLNLKAT